MALTKEVTIDKYEIVGAHKMVQCRVATVISEDGVELSRSFSRYVLAPDADVSLETAETQALCASVHTVAVKLAYRAFLAESAMELEGN